MTSIDRCQAALSGKSLDRLPTYIPAMSCDVASQILGRSALAGTGSLHHAEVLAHSRGTDAHAEFESKLQRDLLDLHRALDIDVFHPPWRMNVKPTRRIDDFTFVLGDENAAHEVWKYEPATADFRPIKSVVPPREIEDWAEQLATDAEVGEGEAMAAIARDVKRHRVVADSLGNQFFYAIAAGAISVGYDANSLMALALAPDAVARRLMVQARLAVELGRQLKASGLPPVILGGGDLAGTRGPLYSPAAFREVVLPAYRHVAHTLNSIGAHYAFRSDGNIWTLADMLFTDAACPGFGEADRDAGMTVGELRKGYPKLVIWGNVSSDFLSRATPAQVRDEARRCADEADGIGYFQACSNAIVKGTPIANVEALFSVR